MGRSQRHMVLEQGNDATGASHVQGVIAPGLLQQAEEPAPPPLAGRGMSSMSSPIGEAAGTGLEAPIGEPGGPLAGSTLTGAVPADFAPATPPIIDDNPPVIASLSPDTAVIGGPSVEMHVIGTGFTDTSVVMFNGSDEPTTFVSDTDISATIQPTPETVPGAVAVNVRNDNGVISAPVNFTFVEPSGDV